MSTFHKKNCSGEKYILLREMGECYDNIQGRYNKLDGKIQWYLRSHIESDGIAAWTKRIQLDNIILPDRPKTKTQDRPSFFNRMLLLIRHMYSLRSRNYPWKRYDKTKRGAGPGIGYALFTREETNRLLEYCRSINVTLTSFLLQPLDKVSAVYLLEKPFERTWLIPVNIRDMITPDTDGNYTSSIGLRLPIDSSIKEIHDKLTKLYNTGRHWGAWIYSNFIGFIGVKKILFIMKYFNNTNFSTLLGVFSNLGNWDPIVSDGYGSEDYRYLAAGPVSIIVPVNAVSITWRGQLALTLQLHPSITEDINDIDNLLKRWVKEIRKLSANEDDSDLKNIIIGVEPKDEFYKNAIRY